VTFPVAKYCLVKETAKEAVPEGDSMTSSGERR
jgi:hypothetical protein